MIYPFWISVIVVFYHLVGYGIILKIINLLCSKPKEIVNEFFFPTITVLCPAFNEEAIIEEKIKSFLELDYPKERIHLIVISDDSTDNTNEIVKKYAKLNDNIELVIQKPRKGKQSGHNLVEPYIHSDYVLSTDANSIFAPDSVKHLITKINSDPNVAIVSGELKLYRKNKKDSGEGLYWKYESWLKSLESGFHSIIGSNGSIYLIKRNFFQQIHPASVDDFERTLFVLKEGYKAKYEPSAAVFENVTERPIEEINRKIRMITQQWFCLERNIYLLNPFKNCKVTFMFISHKLIRWLLPLFSSLIFASSILLYNIDFYKFCLIVQVVIYLSGILEIMLEKRGKSISILKLCAYFTSMNYAALVAFIKYIKREQFSTWNVAR